MFLSPVLEGTVGIVFLYICLHYLDNNKDDYFIRPNDNPMGQKTATNKPDFICISKRAPRPIKGGPIINQMK